jgi:hypothetical protein
MIILEHFIEDKAEKLVVTSVKLDTVLLVKPIAPNYKRKGIGEIDPQHSACKSASLSLSLHLPVAI